MWYLYETISWWYCASLYLLNISWSWSANSKIFNFGEIKEARTFQFFATKCWNGCTFQNWQWFSSDFCFVIDLFGYVLYQSFILQPEGIAKQLATGNEQKYVAYKIWYKISHKINSWIFMQAVNADAIVVKGMYRYSSLCVRQYTVRPVCFRFGW